MLKPHRKIPIFRITIKTMSKKEKSLAQYLNSIIAPILQSSEGNPKSNSPSKSDSSEFLSNVAEVSKENSCDKLPTIHSNNEHQKDLQMLLYQPKVPIAMILEITVGTKIPKILKRFSC